MSKNPANRNVGDHLKEGVKNIKTTYDALYNRKGPGGGADTAKENVKLIVKGKTDSGMPKQSPGTRAGLATMGAASITPLGQVAAFGMGVANSVKAKEKAIARQNAPKPATTATPAAPKPILKIKPGAPGASPAKPTTGAVKPAFTPATKPTAPGAKGPVMGAKTLPKKS